MFGKTFDVRVHLRGGRFGAKRFEEMLLEDHLEALIRVLRSMGADVAGGPVINEADIVVDIEVQSRKCPPVPRRYCIQLENQYIWPANTHDALREYQRLVTWDRSLIGPEVTYVFPPIVSRPLRHVEFRDRHIFAAIIATNRAENAAASSELYSERVRLIREFERRPELSFELWGRGWHLPPQPPGLVFSGLYKALRKLPFDFANLRNYQGMCANKDDVLERVKFNFCFENASGLFGYVTEKIFDSLIAGCVPVYAGAEDIYDYVPSECFVKFDRGCSFDDLKSRLELFGEEDYNKFNLARIEFLNEIALNRHSIEAFAISASRAILAP